MKMKNIITGAISGVVLNIVANVFAIPIYVALLCWMIGMIGGAIVTFKGEDKDNEREDG